MCCFSGTQIVEEVKNTRIFARLGASGNQTLIYSMSMRAKEDVAMVLPIPVKADTHEDAVRFFDFSGYADVFEDLHQSFPTAAVTYAGPFGTAPRSTRSAQLKVVAVGAYEASFVPSIADFTRLDSRFRLPDAVWSKLPGYTHFGFAVFKLRKGRHDVHPMAFSFPTGRPGSVFFPTLHIHDGKVHENEDFDHTLYLQGQNLQMSNQWEESKGMAVQKVKCGLTHGMIRPEMHVYRRTIRGNFPNGDIVVKPTAS
ncbi:MAG: hypothetical protein ABL974_04070 [Prosthecobacter sp.]